MELKFRKIFAKKIKKLSEKEQILIYKKIKLLLDFPFIGRQMENGQARELVIIFGSYSFLVAYKIKNDFIIIISLKHSKQNDY